MLLLYFGLFSFVISLVASDIPISIEESFFRRDQSGSVPDQEHLDVDDENARTAMDFQPPQEAFDTGVYRRIFHPDSTPRVQQAPFVAAILVGDQLWCGAAILRRDRVLTAAHCLQLQYNNRFFREHVKILKVRVGSENATAGGRVFNVTDIVFHPNYSPRSLQYNVAVVHIDGTMKYTAKVQPIQYAKDSMIPSNLNITFYGFGSIWGDGEMTFFDNVLQSLEIPVYPLLECRDIYGADLVTRLNFCAGFMSVLKTVCNHDAGGPAVLDGVLVGVLSFSNKRCDEPDRPAVFTRVGAVVDWLDTAESENIHELPQF